MALTKQAKVLNKHQIKTVLLSLESSRDPIRNKVIFLLSIKAGLRSKEISSLIWSMVTDPEGNLIDTLHLDNAASKGNNGGRVIPFNKELQQALFELFELYPNFNAAQPVILSERGVRMTAAVITNWFRRLYENLGFQGCSSHSGRRTFITNAARAISSVGGSIRDVQTLAGHSSLNMTQRYIEHDTDCQKKLVQLL